MEEVEACRFIVLSAYRHSGSRFIVVHARQVMMVGSVHQGIVWGHSFWACSSIMKVPWHDGLSELERRKSLDSLVSSRTVMAFMT